MIFGSGKNVADREGGGRATIVDYLGGLREPDTAGAVTAAAKRQSSTGV
jgi:hypothetical protein